MNFSLCQRTKFFSVFCPLRLMKADEGDILGTEKARDGRAVVSNDHVKECISAICILAQHNYVGKYTHVLS